MVVRPICTGKACILAVRNQPSRWRCRVGTHGYPLSPGGLDRACIIDAHIKRFESTGGLTDAAMEEGHGKAETVAGWSY